MADSRTKEEQLRCEIINDIVSYHPHSKEFFLDKSIEELINWSHPTYRSDYKEKLRKIQKEKHELT